MPIDTSTGSKRRNQNGKLAPSQTTLDDFFARCKAKTNEKSDDDSVQIIREVKPPKSKDDPDWAVEHGVNINNSQLAERAMNVPVRLKDVLRRKGMQQAGRKNENVVGKDTVFVEKAKHKPCKKDRHHDKSSKPPSHQNLEEGRSDLNFSCSMVKGSTVPEVDMTICKSSKSEHLVLTPNKKAKLPRTLVVPAALSSDKSVESNTNGNTAESGPGKRRKLPETTTTFVSSSRTPRSCTRSRGKPGQKESLTDSVETQNLPVLSLKLLDSQEYYTPSDDDQEDRLTAPPSMVCHSIILKYLEDSKRMEKNFRSVYAIEHFFYYISY